MKFPSLVLFLAALTLGVAPAWSRDYDLKKTGVKTGQAINSEATMAMTDAELAINIQGQSIKGTMSMTNHKVQVTRITAVNDGQITEAESEFKESTQKQSTTVNGQTKNGDKNEPLHGTTVVSKRVNGKWQNQLKSGEPTPEQTKALLKLSAFSSDDIYEDRPIAPGASWAVAPEKIMKLLTESDTGNATGTMQCKFDRIENYNGQPCAVINVDLKFSGTPPDQVGTTITMELKGSVFRSLEEKVDLKVDFAGTMKMEGAVPGAPGATMQVTGPMTMKQTATLAK